MALFKFNKPSNKIINQIPTEVALERLGSSGMDLFINGENAFYFDNKTKNAIQTINLNTMQHYSK
ncbi:hypothetical protein [Clostridium sporogenes]|nr:hypothetical protein [Clostridium sporogenes]PHG98851.1 hypothetical protein CRX47_02965 [Clostridium sporogenes]